MRNGLFAVFAFFSCSQSGRNQRRRTLRKKTKELLEEYLTRRASILGGDIRPLVTHSSVRERLLKIVVISEKRKRERERERERKRKKKRQDIRWEPFLKPICKGGSYDATYF
ncbi:hypothetical protein ALC62_02975 [Cyphomyrmex costatus]|uniref:Uncharacterized protein n=1 Tax=Cyphomyrmex costatus TaxID=456900 RepID=A0A151IMH2_9HYME|nr:hypothetical protein ALC62_02975 [Cyphomyrmex costatus]